MKLFVAILFLPVLFICAPSSAQVNNDYKKILVQFQNWKSAQYKSGKFARPENCNTDTISKPGYKGPEMGIPGDLDISYTDLNGDEIIDGLFTFQPQQCDGGTALKDKQLQVLVLSNGKTYTTLDNYFTKLESKYNGGWFRIDKALSGVIYGTLYKYKKTDGRGAPGIIRPFSVHFLTGQMSFKD